MRSTKILIISSCTGKKKFKIDKAININDFKNKAKLNKKIKHIQKYQCSASEMYTGQQHLLVMQGIDMLQDNFEVDIDLYILSAGYGLIPENKKIFPYEVTFNSFNNQQLKQWSNFLGVHKQCETLILKYDLVFFLLGDKYIQALNLPIQTRTNQTLIFFSSKSSKKYICNTTLKAKTHILELSNQEAKKYSYGLVGLKGFLFKKLCEVSLEKNYIFQYILENPENLLNFLPKSREDIQLELPLQLSDMPPASSPNTENKKAKLFLEIPNTPEAPNTKLGMKYFIPEWDDHVDPSYDFLNDILTPGRDTYEDEVYAHQIYNSPNYDGILVSKVVVESSKKKKKKIEEIGIHNFIRFNGQVMGDCGAFGYIKEEVPPYETKEILDYYENLGFNYGVSIDHLIVGAFAEPGIREKRYQLTIDNAQDFLDRHRAGKYSFTPIGAAQGWSPETYAESVKAYVEMGYDYIAIGGVARTPTKEIIKILKAVRPYLQKNIRLHLFGVARIDAIPIFRHLGVTSFDSASPLRRAWLGSGKNYDTVWGDSYSAIRVPPVNKHGVRVKRLLEANVADKKTLERLEKNTLYALREFEKGEFDVEKTLQTIMEYDSLLELPRDGVVDEKAQAKRIEKHEVMYRQILEEKPWQKCDCKICREIGIEVMIFRGNDRNRRRGFHNTFVFYKRFKEILSKLNKGEVLT
ncbi:tRNA-guanine transglycosylase DpdA [Picosynechococcus sp. PCC 73109]|uniref:tRNA-guanine transglycosylase DpdA n=1 Tax=Picosynechococcus sp. PCC 73109 TaxID=374982 RepID=UPI0007459262|nr:tRNA-guanine transglycosylase DpdA [Picosynechococcus sp. PCC 73109]AMA10652.1 queuine/archaeosine tRNA-ribosyltransferase [Picosynechococcus sp. PCC 73109]